MKDSGVEWIGDIPDSWILNKMKRYFVFNKGINAGLYTKESIHESGLYPVYSGQTENNGILGYLDYYEYDIDEVLFTTTVGAKVMTLNLLSGKFSLSQNCVLIKPKKRLNLKYYYYYLSSLFEYEKSLIPSYMQPSLRILDLQKYTILVPSFLEQQRISKYLDKNIQLITEIINDTKQSIEELKKYKQSLITEVVTKGLDKNVEMKDSGIEWIGEIPKDWETVKLGNFTIKVNNKNTSLKENNLLSLSYGEIIKKNINTSDGLLPENFESYNIVKPGNIVLRMTDLQNDHKSLRTGLVKQKGIITSAYITLKNTHDLLIDNMYLHLILHSFDIKKGFYGMGSGVRQNVTFNDLKKIELCLPDINEQKEIVKYLDSKTNIINKLVSEKKMIINEYESYKKSLIYEYVTGKKEVGEEEK